MSSRLGFTQVGLGAMACAVLMAIGGCSSTSKTSSGKQAQNSAARPAPRTVARPPARPGPPFGAARPGPLAWMLVDLKAFVSPAFDRKAALALLGRPRKQGDLVADGVVLLPSPTLRNLEKAELYFENGELLRVSLTLRTRVRVDPAALSQLLGPAEKELDFVSHFEDLGSPIGATLVFQLRSATHAGSLRLWYLEPHGSTRRPGIRRVELRRRRTPARPRPSR